MARLSGPEEFFEVFHDEKTQQPRGEQPAEHVARQSTASSAPRENTVTVRVRTLVIAGMCSVLLIALSYLVGLSNREASAPRQAGAPPVGGIKGKEPTDQVDRVGHQDDGGQGNVAPDSGNGTGSDAGGEQAPQPKGYILVVATYDKTAVGAQYAKEVEGYLKKQKELDAYLVYKATLLTERHRIVYVGPFTSTRSETAKAVHQAVKRMSYRGRRFNDAYFLKLPQSP